MLCLSASEFVGELVHLCQLRAGTVVNRLMGPQKGKLDPVPLALHVTKPLKEAMGGGLRFKRWAKYKSTVRVGGGLSE